MKLRCDLHVNGAQRKLLLAPGPNESGEHLALKLAGYLLFWEQDPVVDASTKTPALAQYEFLPDVVALDAGGEIILWVECGSTTINKLSKLTRRLPRARLVVLKEGPRDAERLRREVGEQLDKPERIEILAWPEGQFRDWASCLFEKTEVFGEASGHMLNVVVNEQPLVVELQRH